MRGIQVGKEAERLSVPIQVGRMLSLVGPRPLYGVLGRRRRGMRNREQLQLLGLFSILEKAGGEDIIVLLPPFCPRS